MEVGHLLDQALHLVEIGAAPVGQHGFVGHYGKLLMFSVIGVEIVARAIQRLPQRVGRQQDKKLGVRIVGQPCVPIGERGVESFANGLHQQVHRRLPVGDEQDAEEAGKVAAHGAAGAPCLGAHVRGCDQGAAQVITGRNGQLLPGQVPFLLQQRLLEAPQRIDSQIVQIAVEKNDVAFPVEVLMNVLFIPLDLGWQYGHPFADQRMGLLALALEQRRNVNELILCGHSVIGPDRDVRSTPTKVC